MISSFLKSFVYAWQGILTAFKLEMKMRIHIICACAVIFLSLYFHLNALEWMVVVFCIGLVLIAEMFNTALELLADHITPTRHPQIKKIKDIAAGAVLMAAITAAIIWIILIYPHYHQAI